MKLVKSLWLVLLLVIFESVDSKLIINNIINNEVTGYMTRGAQNVYKILIAGVKDLVEPIDPLYLDTINGDLPRSKYQAKNITMHGLRNCTVELFKTEEIGFNFELKLHCPTIVFNYHYDCKGVILESVEFDGQGYANVTIDDYYITIKGKYKKDLSLKDLKPHLSIVSHIVEPDLKGRLTFETNDPIHPDKAKSDLGKAVINEKFKDAEVYLRSPFIENLVALFVQKFNTYLTTFSLDELFPREEKKQLFNVRNIPRVLL